MDTYFKNKISKVFFDYSEDIKQYIFDCFICLYDNNNDYIVRLFDSLCKVKEMHPEFVIEKNK